MVRGGGFEPEKKLERNSFANDNENSAMQMGEGGGSRIGPAICISKALFYLSEKKVHTSRDFSISALS